MNTVIDDTTPAGQPMTRPRVRSRVPGRDTVAVAWRQHRLMLTGTSMFALALAVALLYAGKHAGSIPAATLDLLILLVQLYGLLIAIFWAAPLVAREYEHRTHLWAWSQDVSPARWLAGKVLLLLVTAGVSALVLGFCGQYLVQRKPGQNPFSVPFFDTAPLPQLGYALFGFALGLACSVLTRRSTLSMGLSLVAFLTTRVVLAFYARPHYQTPVRAVSPGSAVPGNAWVTETTRAHVYFQPADRISDFQLIEFGIYAILAALLLVLTWSLLRRAKTL